MLNPEIFREYDIRGIADRDLRDEQVVLLGRAIGTYFRERGKSRMTVGRDVRLSSERIHSRFIEGALACGVDVLDLGECPTPLLYYSLYRLNPDGGIMVTGSHNPAEYNGLKVALGRSTIHGPEIQKIRMLAEREDFHSGAGRLEQAGLMDDYFAELERSVRLKSDLKVVVDCGNGAASLLADKLYAALGCTVRALYCEADGRFPNHHPDPTVAENLKDLSEEVRLQGADLGIAFDGDADRIGVVDERGRILWGDDLMIVFSRNILVAHPGATIIAEVKCSKRLYDEIERLGGKAIMWKAGHSLIKSKMAEENALLGGEMSGHMFFRDRHYGYDDAIYAGARLLEILSASGRKLSEALADIPETYSTPEIRVDCPDRIKFRVVEKAREYFSKRHRTIEVDGVRIEFSDGWGLVRASNTQPVLVLRFEADTQQRLREIRSQIEAKVQKFVKLAGSGEV
ncbi:MAG TPA: phosphomannomutase/phosphoglucomutase [Acidobacteriota bacterium]|nr:phosphomannomutase/phosphoglucomutase [Acidobacteriota bacterium]